MSRLTFLGGAGTVTGSCFLLETGKLKLLVDCGMFQGNRELRMRNYRNLEVPVQSIDYILLTHAHIDHSGLIPRLFKQGFRGKVMATKATVDLCGIMLPDSGHIQEVEAEWETRKARRRGEKHLDPLYTAQDALNCLQSFTGVSYGQEVALDDQVRVRYLDAGHILGSAIIEVWIRENGQEIKTVFSGDLGNKGTPIVRDPAWVAEADYLLLESTYGDRLHPKEDIGARLAGIVEDTASHGGTVVIPSFAVGRTQELLFLFRELIEEKKMHSLPIHVDSPMAIDVTHLYEKHAEDHSLELETLEAQGIKPFSPPNLHFDKTVDDSKQLNDAHYPMVIISASGMATGGRVLHHLERCLPDHRNTILFVGFQAAGTRGKAIQSDAEAVKMYGHDVQVRARIETIENLSAHADYGEILAWLGRFPQPPGKTFIVHGEPKASEALHQRIAQQLRWDATVPAYLQQVTL